MTLEKQLRRSTILAVIFSILGGATLGFIIGYKVRTVTHVCHVERIKIAGYVKVGYGKGVTNLGDTIDIFEYADRK